MKPSPRTMPLVRPDIPRRYRPRAMDVIHEDRDIIIIDKEQKLLTMSYRPDETRTAEWILNSLVRKGNPRSHARVFVVHRLDRDTSGVLIFARTHEAQQQLKNNWKQTEKHYLAAVHGRMAKKAGVFSSHLAEDGDQFVHSVSDPGEGRLAETAYAVIKEYRDISIVRINLLTGRKNQIRVHFADAGHPVVGDRKYGRPDTPRERLALHAKAISFPHPHRGTPVFADVGIPEYFQRIAGGLTEEEWASVKAPGG